MVNDTELAVGGTLIKPPRGALAEHIPSDGKPLADSTTGIGGVPGVSIQQALINRH